VATWYDKLAANYLRPIRGIRCGDCRRRAAGLFCAVDDVGSMMMHADNDAVLA